MRSEKIRAPYMHRNHMKYIAWILVWSILIWWVWIFFERYLHIMEMMIAWKSISIEAKLISGASCVSWRSRLGHYPKDLWWTSLISIECTLLYSKIYYGSLARLRRITIYIQVVEKSWSMWTPNSILKYTIVIIFMASLFWKIPKLKLNFWWYSFKCCAKTEVAHRNSEKIIFRPEHLRLFPHEYSECFLCAIT